MLTVEIGLRENGEFSEVVEIYFDKDGLDYLLYRIKHIEQEKQITQT